MVVKLAILVSLIVFSLTFPSLFSQSESQISSPRLQMDSGVNAIDVICKSGYVLMIRTTNGAAACVSPTSGTTLESRGWGIVASEPFEEMSSNQEVDLEENIPIESEQSDTDEDANDDVIEVNIEDGVGAGDTP